VLGFIEPSQRSQEQPFRPANDPVPDSAVPVRSSPSHVRSISRSGAFRNTGPGERPSA
jgi:hypothetical protein